MVCTVARNPLLINTMLTSDSGIAGSIPAGAGAQGTGGRES